TTGGSLGTQAFGHQSRGVTRSMRHHLTVERLESRDLLSGTLGLIELPRLNVLTDWHQAEVRSVLSNGAEITSSTPLLTPGIVENTFGRGVGAEMSSAQRWDRLLVGTWYVPPANLLAYLVGPAGANPVPIADQTIFQITSAHDGVFSGENSVQLSRPTALGWLRPEPMRFTMAGVVTPEGRIRILFKPIDSHP